VSEGLISGEAYAKMQAEKAYCADQVAVRAARPSGGTYGSGTQMAGDCEDQPLFGQLKMRQSIATNERQQLNRAVDILKTHPEFEDFLWLLRSGLV